MKRDLEKAIVGTIVFVAPSILGVFEGITRYYNPNYNEVQMQVTNYLPTVLYSLTGPVHVMTEKKEENVVKDKEFYIGKGLNASAISICFGGGALLSQRLSELVTYSALTYFN